MSSTMRATWRLCAVGCKTPGHFGLGNPVPRDDCERGSRPIRHAASAGTAWRRRFTGDFRGRSPARFTRPQLLDLAALKQALADTLAQEEQSLLFLNRRGYAPLTVCRACVTVSSARNARPGWSSTASPVVGVSPLRLHRSKPDACPECGAEDRMVACGPGVERLAEEIDTCSRKRGSS